MKNGNASYHPFQINLQGLRHQVNLFDNNKCKYIIDEKSDDRSDFNDKKGCPR